MDSGAQTNYWQCAHTELATNPWWRVDLGRVEDVAEVHILGRKLSPQSMHDAEIRVGK